MHVLAPVLSLLWQPAPAAPQEVVTVTTFGEFLASGGPIMVPILLCSVVVLAFALERYLSLRRSRILPASIDEALTLLRGERVDEARALVESSKAPAARILAAGLRRRGYSVQDVEKAMEDQAQKEADRMRGNIRPLSIVANVAPLMGLLGTVIGIAEAFHSVVKTGMGKPENLAAGIEEALTTTITGLVIAIPALVLAAHLHSKVRRLLLRTDETLAPAVELLAARPDTEKGHAA